MDRTFDLKLGNGRVVQWTGETGEDAAARYMDAKRVGDARPNVIAWREPRIHVGPVHPSQIVG